MAELPASNDSSSWESLERAGGVRLAEDFGDHAGYDQRSGTADHVLYLHETGRRLWIGRYEVQQVMEVPVDEAGRAAGWRRVPEEITAGGHRPGQPDQASQPALEPLSQTGQCASIVQEFAKELRLLGGDGQALTVNRVEDADRVAYRDQTLRPARW